MTRTPVLATAVCLALAVLATIEATGAPKRGRSMLAKLIEDDWQYQLEHSPTYASVLGDRRWNDRWDDRSLAAIEADHRHDLELIARLDAIPRKRLSPEEQLDYDLFRRNVEQSIGEYELGWHFLPVNHMGSLPEGIKQPPGIQTAGQLAGNLRFETVKDFEDWIARLDGLEAYVDQHLALMREGVKRKLVHPRIVLSRIPAQLDRQLVDDPEKSELYAPFVTLPPSIPAADARRLRAAAATSIRARALPALRRFRAYLVDEYIPAAPEAVGAWQWPRGEEIYAYWARRYTTTDRSVDEIHELGLAEVARLRAEMRKVMVSTGWKGTMPEFFTHLRTAPRFFHKSPEELLLHYRALAKRIDPTLVKLFRTLPRAPYAVEPTPAAMAPDVTTGFYYPGAADGSRPGTYLVNLYRPETRPRWEMVPLTLHEAVPGHHLQMALAAEQQGLAPFRRYGYYMAFGEGWALYCETLGDELGLLDDPYDRFGQLAYEMWRAVRLVVDTGMHHKKWTRAQALQYFLEASPRPELDATNEIDRYIAMPGQALAYKIGQLEIRALRTRAEKALGETFDVRAFHDVVLLSGTLPLDVLGRRVDAWIADQRRR